jgi:Raf kinase inhibitor-like YbhB/YbcL family protein
MRSLTACIILLFSLATLAIAQSSPQSQPAFQISSTTFTNGQTLPLVVINNIVSNGVNSCSLTGAAGGNESPELSWANAPANTATFVVTTYDSTAAFTHWGMYNIAGTATGLPENAGVPDSTYGSQILNDFEAANEYDGPCPPDGYRPYNHRYVFTVYALDISLNLHTSPNFPANAETLYQALISAGEHHHILASSSLIGFYSTTPSK